MEECPVHTEAWEEVSVALEYEKWIKSGFTGDNVLAHVVMV